MKIKHRFPKGLIAIAAIVFSLVAASSSFAIATKSKTPIITSSATPRAGGTITPSGRVQADYGQDFTFDVAPNANYEIADVLVEGESQGPVSQYTFQDVTGNHRIQAKFRLVNYTITVTAGDNIQISPSGTITATYGKKVNFTIKPLNGDTAPMLLLDGAKVDLSKSGNGYKFTLTVNGNHAVFATFEIAASVYDNTKIVDASTLQSLSSISEDGTVLTFAGITPLLQSLSPGDVLVFGSSVLTPNGLLRKVINSSMVGSQVVVDTTQATLADVLKTGQIQISETITPGDLSSTNTSLIKGMTLKNRETQAENGSQSSPISYELKNVDLGGVLASGSISLQPGWNFYVEFPLSQPPILVFTVTMTQV